MKPQALTQQSALEEAARKAGHDRAPITALEQGRIIEQLKRDPLPVVKRSTGRSYKTLCRIAEACL